MINFAFAINLTFIIKLAFISNPASIVVLALVIIFAFVLNLAFKIDLAFLINFAVINFALIIDFVFKSSAETCATSRVTADGPARFKPSGPAQAAASRNRIVVPTENGEGQGRRHVATPCAVGGLGCEGAGGGTREVGGRQQGEAGWGREGEDKEHLRRAEALLSAWRGVSSRQLTISRTEISVCSPADAFRGIGGLLS